MFETKGPWINRRVLLSAGFSAFVIQPARPKSDRMISVGRCQIAMSVVGSGRPAVFIHGFGANKFTWRKIIPRLASTFKCYSVDLPGYGDSIAPDDFDYSIESMSDVIADLAIKENLQKALIVANSLGSAITLLATIRRKEFRSRITSLCIIDGVCYPQSLPYFVELLRVPILGELITEVVPSRLQVSNVLSYCYFNDELITPTQISGYAEPFSRPQVREAMRKTARAIDQEQLEKYIPSIKLIRIPSLLIWGDKDKVVPLNLGQRLHQDIKGSTFRVIPNCGHIPQEECPQSVITAIEEFGRSQSA